MHGHTERQISSWQLINLRIEVELGSKTLKWS